MAAEIVYILCAIAAAACAVLLFRGYARSRARLLLWSGLCFTGLCFNSALLFVDMVLLPDIDLLPLRTASALASLVLLLFGLIWDSQ